MILWSHLKCTISTLTSDHSRYDILRTFKFFLRCWNSCSEEVGRLSLYMIGNNMNFIQHNIVAIFSQNIWWFFQVYRGASIWQSTDYIRDFSWGAVHVILFSMLSWNSLVSSINWSTHVWQFWVLNWDSIVVLKMYVLFSSSIDFWGNE